MEYNHANKVRNPTWGMAIFADYSRGMDFCSLARNCSRLPFEHRSSVCMQGPYRLQDFDRKRRTSDSRLLLDGALAFGWTAKKERAELRQLMKSRYQRNIPQPKASIIWRPRHSAARILDSKPSSCPNHSVTTTVHPHLLNPNRTDTPMRNF